MAGGREIFAVFLRNLTQNGNCSFTHVFFGNLPSAHYMWGSVLDARLPVVSKANTIPFLPGGVRMLLLGPDLNQGITKTKAWFYSAKLLRTSE